jgi:hypothetical protein
MAFTNAEFTKIRAVLGYPNAFRYKNVRLESALVQADADGEVYIRAELAAIAEVDATLLSDGVGFSSAGVKKVDEIEFQTGNGASTVTNLKKLGRHHIGRISAFFGTPIHTDYYGEGGYPGDSWSDGMGTPYRGGNSEVRLG